MPRITPSRPGSAGRPGRDKARAAQLNKTRYFWQRADPNNYLTRRASQHQMQAPEPTDAQQWDAFRRGEQAAYAALYDRHAARLYEYGLRLVQQEDLVRDALHDLFVKLWTNRAKLGGTDNIRYYLLAALHNTLLSKKRRDQRYQHVALDEGHAFQLSFSPEAELLQHEQHTQQSQQLLAALDRLSPRQKQVIYLRYYEELEYQQIAELLDITVKGVYKLTARALDALKDIMQVSRPLLLALLLAWRHGA